MPSIAIMTNSTDWLGTIVRDRTPMSPLTSDVSPRLSKLDDIRAVIFDVYGTLLISGSGDVGSADESSRGERITNAFKTVFPDADSAAIPTIEDLHTQIRSVNEARKSDSCPKPEVDIVDIWRRTLCATGNQQLASDTGKVVQLATLCESLANPTWPMPGAKELLGQLAEREIAMGIVSNAQIFTVRLMQDLLSGQLEDNGFDTNLCIFSNRFRQAKPGPRLFSVLCSALSRRGIEPEQAVYVGNDMLNDTWAAKQAGLKTAWFVGDRRSCRPRADETRCKGLLADVVISDLMQLLECVSIR